MAHTHNKLAEYLHGKTLNTLKELNDIWIEIGINDEIREQRDHLFIKYVEKLYKDMLMEAKESKSNLLEHIESLLQELAVLCRDLHVDNESGYEFQSMPLLKVKQELKDRLQKLEEQRTIRLSEIKKLLAKENLICKTLGKKTKGLEISPLPSSAAICEFESYLEELSDLKFKREEVFLKCKSRIIEIMNVLKIKPSLDFERIVVCCEDSAFLVTEENMKNLEELHKSLEKQLEDTKNNIAELRERLTNLWERLEECPQVRSAFSEEHTGNSVITLIALKEEVKRCEEKKRANIKLYVDKMRHELVVWWDKCYYSPEQRATFMHFTSDCYTEDLLTLHEIQVQHIKSYYEKNKNIYELYNKRQKLWDKMTNLDQRANQPDRFKNRGGQLLNEEKERKAVASELPKVENELLDLVSQYENQNRTDFLINGEPVQDVLTYSWEERKENMQKKLSVKKQLREHSRLTPSRSHLALNTILTPTICVNKRKLPNSTQGKSKRSRLNNSQETKYCTSQTSTKKSRLSIERRRKLAKRRSRSRLQNNNTTTETTVTNYEGFENGLANKSSCRSSLFQNKIVQTKSSQSNVVTPRKILQTQNRTPQRTPSRLNFRPKSPLLTPRLAAAPSNLPIII